MLEFIHKYITNTNFYYYKNKDYQNLLDEMKRDLAIYIENFNNEFHKEIKKGELEKIDSSYLVNKIDSLKNTFKLKVYEIIK